MSKQPRIKISPSAMEIAGIILLAASWFLAINGLITYPEIIPVHFNASGVPDGYGSKFTLSLLPGIATVIWIGITFLNRSPHILNYPVAITEENAERMYRSVIRLMRIIKITVPLLFLMILYMTHRVVKGNASGIGKGFLIIALAMMILPVMFFTIKMATSSGEKKIR